MTGVLKVRQNGAWVDVLVPGPPGPQGPAGAPGAAGATGPQGPAGPQQQYVQMGENGAAIGLAANVWSEFQITTLTLPFLGKYLIEVWGTVGCAANTAAEIHFAIGLNGTNMGGATYPVVYSPSGETYTLGDRMVVSYGAGNVGVSFWAFTSGSGGSMRRGRVVATYQGPL